MALASFASLVLAALAPLASGAAEVRSPAEIREAAERAAVIRVFAAEARAGLLLRRDADEALAIVKQALEATREAPYISEKCRAWLESRLERACRDVVTLGTGVKQRQIERQVYRSELKVRVAILETQVRAAYSRLVSPSGSK